MHILVLTDRDWTHPQGGGTGTNLYGQVSRWLAWGHRVSVVACSYPGARRTETIGQLTIHRIGGRSTVFPRAIWAQWRGLVARADVALEVINGITFLTPLWLRTPRLALIHHIHRDHYVQEMGRKGRLAAWLLETLPLKLLYRHAEFMTLSNAEAERIAAHGIPRERIEVNRVAVEHGAFAPGERAPEPTLLYLGRLKRYKRVEVLLDVLEAVPGAVLDIAGDGDRRAALEREIERRGLGGRVRMHGHVDERRKRELLQRAWVNLTASSAEGWGLSVIEAAACATPSVALSVGGLAESIEDGRTGLLARDPAELAAQTRRIVEDPELRERLGRAARERAGEMSWDGTAWRTLELMEEARARADGRPEVVREAMRGDTARAGGLAAAVMAGNVVGLLFTIVFARVLGAGGYGSLAALISTLLILQVPGAALQITVAREVSRAVADGRPDPGAGTMRWLRQIAVATVAVALVAVALRDVLAAAIGVDAVWAAAATLPTACFWLLLSVVRGALQGFQRYRAVGASIVGEGLARIAIAVALVVAGLGVTGAFLGTTLSILAMALVLLVPLGHELAKASRAAEPAPAPRLRDLIGRAWAPVLGLALILVLQEVHVIVLKHEAPAGAAGSWAAAAVAAKAIVWVAIGLGLYLLPEAARRSHAGEDARPVLGRMLMLIGCIAAPMVLFYALAAEPLLRAVFGGEFTQAAGALPWLALAMTLLACAYLSVQYLLALGRASFLWLLGVAAVAEPLIVLGIGAQLTEVALGLAALLLVVSASVLAMSFASRPAQAQRFAV